MYRYYSTEYPIRPDTFPLFANTVVSFKEKTDIPGVGSVWGYLEYEQQLSAGVAETCGLTQAKTRTFTVKVTSVHTLEVEAENEEVAIEQACGMASTYSAWPGSMMLMKSAARSSLMETMAGQSPLNLAWLTTSMRS